MVHFIKSQLQRLPTANQLQQYKPGQDGKYAKGNGPALVYNNIHVLCHTKKVESLSFLSSNYFRTCLCETGTNGNYVRLILVLVLVTTAAERYLQLALSDNDTN